MKFTMNLEPKANSTRYYCVRFGKSLSFVVSSPLCENEMLTFICARLPMVEVMDTISVKETAYHSNDFYRAVENKRLIGLSKLADMLSTIKVEFEGSDFDIDKIIGIMIERKQPCCKCFCEDIFTV